MRASEIAEFVDGKLCGQDLEIKGVCSLENSKPDSLAFCTFGGPGGPFVLDEVVTVLVTHECDCNCLSYIRVDNPRLAHALVTREFFMDSYRMIPTGEGMLTLPGSGFLGVDIYEYVEIGEGCYFKPGVVIGGSGFGFEFGEDKIPVLRPHVGGVKIGNNVQVGTNSVIDRGTIDDTIIGDNVKIDNLVHISHNCQIGDNTCIVAGSVICGSATIGKNCWIGANSTIMNQVTIGDNVTIGIGANVVEDVPSGSVIAGVKAQTVWRMKLLASKIEEM